MICRMIIKVVGRTPTFTRTSLVGLDFRPGKLPLLHVCPILNLHFQGNMGILKDAMHGVEVGLSPYAWGSARFHIFQKHL